MYKRVCTCIFPSSVHGAGLEAMTSHTFSCYHMQTLKHKPRPPNNTQAELEFELASHIQIQHFSTLKYTAFNNSVNPNQLCSKLWSPCLACREMGVLLCNSFFLHFCSIYQCLNKMPLMPSSILWNEKGTKQMFLPLSPERKHWSPSGRVGRGHPGFQLQNRWQ